MTFCIGIRVNDGLVALSDTRVVRGEQISRKAKLSTLPTGGSGAIVMTSGLRSVRDKVVRRLEDDLRSTDVPLTRMYRVATAFGEQLRSVRAEDGESLDASGLSFNTHAVLGGQLPDDPDPALLEIFPEGNWVEATADAPYFIVGRSYYGKPILDRLLTYDTPLPQATALAYLAFDATRTSATDVDFPIDVAVLPRGGSGFAQRRYTAADLEHVHASWQTHLRGALDELPSAWIDPLLSGQEAEDRP